MTLRMAVLIAAMAASTTFAWDEAQKKPDPFPALARQTQLDRAGFSPGEIDGKEGTNTAKALEAYTAARGALQPAGQDEALTTYQITAADAAGPFTKMPADMMAKAKLKSLGYSSLAEALGERFHSSPALLTALNSGKRFVAGTTIRVPNVRAAQTAGANTASSQAAKVVVSKAQSNLTAFDASGAIIFFAPVTSGSEHDPLPLGDWLVSIVSRNPTFNYNPELFWDADPSHTKTKLAAGPNGPVGVVWIQISKENYGIHGTSEPGQVGHSESHGCVRLTNWDVATLANMVKKGTPVVFVE